ncbi:ATP-binding protein [Rhodoferax saidenbachensis]|nr:ATP-binding protein [Rhodoferax saidenbachensis]
MTTDKIHDGSRHMEPTDSERGPTDASQDIQGLVFRTLIGIMPDRIYAKDTQGRFILANKAVANLMGKSTPEEMIGKTDFDFYSKELASEYFAVEQALIHSGESLIACEQFVPNLSTGEPGWLETTKVHLRDPQGNVIGLVGLARDITERKRIDAELLNRNKELTEVNAKLFQAQEQLLQSEKMASLGQLAAGVAHEINNPIGFVNSNLGSLQRYVEELFQMLSAYEAREGELKAETLADLDKLKQEIDISFLRKDVVTLLAESMDGMQRVKRIVQDLKNFSHVDESERQWANLERGLDSTLNMARNEIKYKAEVVKEYAGIPEIECMPSQLNQVFMNLIVNAAHAIEDHGTITVRTGINQQQVWVEVSDTGSGISKEHLPRIFDPFYTTKPVGKGTGLGLSLSYGIIQRHHGSIDVSSEPGKGSSFRVNLPIKWAEGT